MAREQFALERIGMVEVDVMPVFGTQSFEVAVIRIVRDPLDTIASDAVVDGTCNGRFTGAGAPGNSNENGFHACSAYSASVMKSAGSSAPHVLQTTVASLPLMNSNWYVGVSQLRQIR